MARKLCLFLVSVMAVTLLSACGDSTPVPATIGSTVGQVTTAAPSARATIPLVVNNTTPGAAATESAIQPATARPALPATAKAGGTLTIFFTSQVPVDLHPTPAVPSSNTNWTNLYPFLQGPSLVNYNDATFKWEYATAQSLKIDPSGKVYTFTLRPDLKWSNGTPLTVDDYLYTYENTTKADSNPARTFVDQPSKAKIVGVKADNAAGTLEFTLEKDYPLDLALYFIAAGTPPIPRKTWDNKPFYDATANPEINKPTVGAGPYIVESWNPPNEGVLKVNPNWYRGKPNFDKVVIKTGAANVAYEALKSGLADYAYSVPDAQYDEAKANPSVNVVDWVPIIENYYTFDMNTKKAPWNDKTLRQAVAYSINRKDVNRIVFRGQGVEQYSMLNPLSQFANQNVEKYDYNLEKARKLLADAGYKLDNGVLLDKEAKPVKGAITFGSSRAEQRQLATLVQQSLKQIGIEVTLDGQEQAAFRAFVSAKKHDLAINKPRGSYPDPDASKVFYTSTGTFNNSAYSNPVIDELFAKGGEDNPFARRKEIYDEMQKIIADDAPSIPLVSPRLFLVTSKKLAGVVPAKADIPVNNQSFVDWYFLTTP